MVNAKISIRKYILAALRDTPGTVSGQEISDGLHISRVALWKHIKSLRELGYDIQGTSTGYVLSEESDRDYLYPWEFDSEQGEYHSYGVLTSTMDIAREKAEKGCRNHETFIAETQKDGRDRKGSKWISNEGGLYFTTVFRPTLPPAYSYLHTLAATAVICEVFHDLYHIQARAKWPNEVLIGNEKISGVLTEMHMTGTSVNWLNLGVGINVNNSTDLNQSTSIKEKSGVKQDRRKLLGAYDKRLRTVLSENSPSQIRNYWIKHSATINRNICLESSSGRVLKGKVENIDESGSLLIRRGKNLVEQALFGDLYINTKIERGE